MAEPVDTQCGAQCSVVGARQATSRLTSGGLASYDVKRRLSPAPLALAAVLVLAASVLAACGGSGVAAPRPGVGTQLDRPVPASILDLPFRDQDGQVRRLSDFAGKVVVISDSMTLCQEHCPLDTAAVVRTAQTVDAAGQGGGIVFLTVTVDPARDTVPQIAAYRRLYKGPANWLTLTGSPSAVRKLWAYFGVYVKKVPEADHPAPRNWRTGTPLTYDIDHSDEVFFLDTHAHERFVLEGIPYIASKSQIPATIYHFLSAHGRRNVASGQAGWTEAQAVQAVSWMLDKKIAS